MKFTVLDWDQKPHEFEWEAVECYSQDARRVITTGLLWMEGGILATGVAVKHPSDSRCFEGERLAFTRALKSATGKLTRRKVYYVDVREAWKRATSKAWQEANGKA